MLFVHYCNVMVYLVYCVASGKQEKVQACLVTLWLFTISCHSLSKTTLGSLCSWKPAWSLKKCPHSMCLKPVFDFYAGPSVRGRQLYCRACNFKNVSALLAGNFYTSYIDPNRLPLLRDTGTTRFYSKYIHLVMIQSNTSERCQNCINRTQDVKIVSTELEMSKLYQRFPQRK